MTKIPLSARLCCTGLSGKTTHVSPSLPGDTWQATRHEERNSWSTTSRRLPKATEKRWLSTLSCVPISITLTTPPWMSKTSHRCLLCVISLSSSNSSTWFKVGLRLRRAIQKRSKPTRCQTLHLRRARVEPPGLKRYSRSWRTNWNSEKEKWRKQRTRKEKRQERGDEWN